MVFFLGIYDADTIECAFGRQSKTTTFDSQTRPTSSDSNTQLKRDWADLMDKFSWRLQPSDPGKVF